MRCGAAAAFDGSSESSRVNAASPSHRERIVVELESGTEQRREQQMCGQGEADHN